MAQTLYPIKLYLKNRVSLATTAVTLFLNLAIWVELLWRVKPQDEPIFLHYTILFGVDLAGEWWKVFYLPIAGLCIFIVNTIIGWILFQRDSFGSIIMQVCSVFCQIMLLIQAVLLVFLNG